VCVRALLCEFRELLRHHYVFRHENTHGFDNQGSKYNGDGKLQDWWTPETAAQFQDRLDCIIAQYSQYEVLPGVYVNGNLTQGENCADIGGVKLAMNAYIAHIADEKPNDPSPVPGFTNLQLYVHTTETTAVQATASN
jgi:putative endopeptidase